ncbi:MAG TPA: SDR family NAD(P)-dependent oxidoreductase [Trebonia sp.]|jgi:NAD(P)-dependent dehydrogenase (short-subunit alcohol dehydrogenase family)
MSGTRITTPFGPTSTAADVIAGVDLTGKRAIVTGASSGIGQETARVLAGAGAEVTLAVRDIAAGEMAAAEIAGSAAGQGVRVARLDLADRASVGEFAAGWAGPLHVLVNNAGIMATPERRTPEGWELQFATNHLGHFALTTGLHGALAATDGARVVMVSSVGHVNGEVLFDDVNFERRPYNAWVAYSQSKTANILFAVEAARRWAADEIAVNALNPGRIASTGLISHVDPAAVPPPSFDAAGTTGVSVKDVPQGAATSVLLAASPLVEGVTGKYFEDCQEADPFVPGIRRGVAAYALDPEKAARLWQLSLDLLAATEGPGGLAPRLGPAGAMR